MALLTASLACGSQGSPAVPSPQGSNSSSARIDGVLWTPSRVFLSMAQGNANILAGEADNSVLLAIVFSRLAVGTYRAELEREPEFGATLFQGANGWGGGT